MPGEPVILEPAGLADLFAALQQRGYQVVGPTVRDGAIVLAELDSADELPRGWTDRQDGGQYRLERRRDDALFGYTVGPHSWKQYLHAPVQRLWRTERSGDAFRVIPEITEPPRRAFLGARACDLRAIAVQDRVLTGGRYVDLHYQARRDDVFVVAVNCGEAGGTCFCVSMGTGPRVETGYDLLLTELMEAGEHRLLLEAGSEEGEAVLAVLPRRAAAEADLEEAEALLQRTAASMGREMRAEGVRELLLSNLEHPRWDSVAERCLACGNCTQVCPTCFCTSAEEETCVDGESSIRSRRWDSCFTMEHSYLHGGSVHGSIRARYRQWLTHKLATWHDQFGSSGCVGCGRCITWCPVGIDITEEVEAIHESSGAVTHE